MLTIRADYNISCLHRLRFFGKPTEVLLLVTQCHLPRLGVESGVSHFDDAHMAASSVTLLRQSVFAEIIGRIKIAATNDLLKTDPHVYDEKLNECAELWQNSINQSMAQGIVKGDSNYAR